MMEMLKDWWWTFVFVGIQLFFFIFIMKNAREGLGWICVIPLAFILFLTVMNVYRLRRRERFVKEVKDMLGILEDAKNNVGWRVK